MAKLSVIVPIYNMEKYLQKCVDSILAQTFRDFELILVDDGSKDKSVEICDDYARKDERVKVIHKENGGPGSARNAGLEKVTGEYMTFVDPDDYIDKDHFQNFMDNCDRADMVIQGVKFVSEEGELIHVAKLAQEKYIPFPVESVKEIWGYLSYTWNKIYKTEIFKENHILYPENCSVLEDRMTNMRYYQYINSFLFLPTASYNYLQRADSLAHKKHHSLDLLLFVANAFDKCPDLGKAMNEMNMWYTARFYLRATCGLFTPPPQKFIKKDQRMWRNLA